MRKADFMQQVEERLNDRTMGAGAVLRWVNIWTDSWEENLYQEKKGRPDCATYVYSEAWRREDPGNVPTAFMSQGV